MTGNQLANEQLVDIGAGAEAQLTAGTVCQKKINDTKEYFEKKFLNFNNNFDAFQLTVTFAEPARVNRLTFQPAGNSYAVDVLIFGSGSALLKTVTVPFISLNW